MKRFSLGVGLVFLLALAVSCVSAGEGTPTAVRQVTTPTSVPGVSPAATATRPPAPAPTATKGPARGGTLRLGTNAEGTTLDPHAPATSWEVFYKSNIYETLLEVTPALKIEPGLAESWQVSPDGMTLTFKLRKGVKFHDGTDLNAAAVKFSFERLLTIEPRASLRTRLADVKSIDVVDDYTVKLTMERPSAPTLANLAYEGTEIISRAAVEKWGKDEYGRHGVGTGPFALSEWVRDDHLTVKRFDGYWKKEQPFVDELLFKPVVDTSVRFANLRAGTFDWIASPPVQEVANLKTSKDLKYDASAPTWSYVLFLNTAVPPFDKQAVRQAINWAIDRESINKGVLFGAYTPQGTLSQPSVWPYDPNFKGYTYDPDKAKAKMAEGGVPNGFEFTINVGATPLYVTMVEALQAQLAKLGIKVQVETMDPSAIYSLLPTRKFQAVFSPRSSAVDQYTIYADWVTGAPRNHFQYNNPKFNDLVSKATSAFSEAEKTTIYREIEKELVENPLYAYIVFTPQEFAMSQKVKGWTSFPLLKYPFGGVWLEK